MTQFVVFSVAHSEGCGGNRKKRSTQGASVSLKLERKVHYAPPIAYLPEDGSGVNVTLAGEQFFLSLN